MRMVGYAFAGVDPALMGVGPIPSTERALTPDQLARMPIDAGDLALLATLAPGVVAIPGTDSTAASFSVAGQRPGDNNVTLDGVSFGAASVPQDGVRAGGPGPDGAAAPPEPVKSTASYLPATEPQTSVSLDSDLVMGGSTVAW